SVLRVCTHGFRSHLGDLRHASKRTELRVRSAPSRLSLRSCSECLAERWRKQACIASVEPRVEQPYARVGERTSVARDEREVVLEGGGGHQSVDRRERTCGTKLTPSLCNRRRDRKDALGELILQHIDPRRVSLGSPGVPSP